MLRLHSIGKRWGANQVEVRSLERLEANRVVSCRVPAAPNSATILDITAEGCRIKIANGVLVAGGTILLELMQGFHAIGTVVWKKNDEAGVKFERGIHPSLVDHVSDHWAS